jgi:hypothetical protein
VSDNDHPDYIVDLPLDEPAAAPADALDICDLAILSALRRCGLDDAIRRAREDLPSIIGITFPTGYEVSVALPAIAVTWFPGVTTTHEQRDLTTESVIVTGGRQSVTASLSNPGMTILVAECSDVDLGRAWHIAELADTRIDVTVTATDIHAALAQAYPDLRDEQFEVHERATVGDLGRFLQHETTGWRVLRAVNKMARRRSAHTAKKAEEDEKPASRKKVRFPITEPTGVKLSGLPGFGAARPWAMQLAADLQGYLAGTVTWEDIDRGALLVGPPGSGKSTFMRALASECGIPMIFTGFQDFSNNGEGHMGTVIKGIKSLFVEAQYTIDERKVVIVAIDEIDSIPPRGVGYHPDYWAPIVNALLAEINGRPGMIVVGTANSANVDPALIRPGRMDRIIEIGRPQRDEIGPILRHHLGVDIAGLDTAAACLFGSSAADLEQIARSARRRARVLGRVVSMTDIVAAIDEIRPPIRDAELAFRIAHHEAGHAIAMLSSPQNRDVELHMSGTFSAAAGSNDNGVGFQSLGYLSRRLVELLAGRIAEQKFAGDLTRGSGGGLGGDMEREEASDLRRATLIALELETQHGVGVSGLVHVPGALESALLQPDIYRAVRARLDAARAEAERIIEDRWHVVGALAVELVRERYIAAERVREIVARADALKPRADAAFVSVFSDADE